MLPGQEYFYTFRDLPVAASPAQIRRAYPGGVRRQFAFKHFYESNREDVRYLLGYVAEYARNGVYDELQYKQCFDLIDTGLRLRDRDGCHRMLQMLKTELAAQQTAIVEECGPDSPTDADSPWLLFRSGNHQQIFARFDELESTVQPRGILGPPEEKEFWMLSQFMVRICFMKGKLADGLSRLGDYEQGRIAVKLTPMPDYDIQEAVLGHLAGRSITEALSRLQFWLDHSRMPTVSDVISNHPSFKHLFEEQVQ